MARLCFKRQFLNFPHFKNYIKDCNWEKKALGLENSIKVIILYHLQLQSENFEKYFSQKLHQDSENSMWVINPFIVDCRKRKFWRHVGNTAGDAERFFYNNRFSEHISITGIIG